MLSLTTAQQDAITAGVAMRRVFIWCEARDPDTGDPAPAGFWDDVGNVTVGARTYTGSGQIVEVATMSAKGDLTIPSLDVVISGIAAEAAALIRGSTVGQAPIEVSLGIFNVETRELLPPLIPRFVGKVDEIDIQTPESGGLSTVTLTCESTSRALTIRRTETRSEANRKALWAGDKFYDYTGLQRDRPVYFGRKEPKR